jgi:hypothetical protein
MEMTWTPVQDEKMDCFEAILVEHPRKTQLHAALGNLMHETTRASRRHEARVAAVGGRPVKAEELYLLPVIGPSGATKTKSLSTYVDSVLEPHRKFRRLFGLSYAAMASCSSAA